MNEKLSWLLESHYNLFHADMIQRALNDDSISLQEFVDGCTAIDASERYTENDEFTPKEFSK